MKLKKIIAAIAAAAVAVSTMAVNAFAADEYQAVLGFADTAWAAQDWEAATTVTGDGQYTIESTLVAGACDFGVFVIDIQGMYAGNPEATAVLDKVEVDGAEISFDAAGIQYGDIEEKGNYRIEIYNQYGHTKDNPPVNQATPISSSVKVTFTVSGLGGGAAEAAPEATTEAPATGNAPIAAMAVVMALAGTAAVVSKKK
ncbi:MAG: hypothetical protein J6A05_08360 [Oscillospiraceae bacterium]|nr:hypothetical protein [Oscillospiraceae bacterium]